ncbi:MAG: hypothetical protein HQK89_06705 [Nitrospirae bacterium]|nr:hypothetical protein [Nitrospirota bacterium]
MGNDKFSEGTIKYKILSGMEIDEVAKHTGELSEWSNGDGYIAFSNRECRLNDFLNNSPGLSLKDLLAKRDTTGYLMEIGLWREKNGTVEEICIEREDSGFHFQNWILYKEVKKGSGEGGCVLCYYRSVETLPREKPLPRENTILSSGDEKSIRSYEVVLPEKWLHFFIIAGKEDRKNAGG